MSDRKEIVAAIISALQNSRVASDSSELSRNLIRVASANEEIRPHVIPHLLEEPPTGTDKATLRLLGKGFKLAYGRPEIREEVLPVIRMAMDKLGQGTGGFPKKDFSMWAKEYRRMGRSVAPRNKGKEVTMGLYAKFNPNEVAAVPSLHGAYPFIIGLFSVIIWKKKGIPAFIYPVLVWCAAVYLQEHYIVDLILGWIYVGIGLFATYKIFDYRERKEKEKEAPQKNEVKKETTS